MQVNRSPEISYGNQNYKGKKCDYCHYTGHTRENCYKLIGYPTDWKQRRRGNYNNGNPRGAVQNSQSGGFNNGQQYGNQVRTNFAGNNSNGETSHYASQSNEGNKEVNNAVLSRAQGFTDGEYKQIMELLNKDPHEMKQINMSGMSTCLLSHVESQEWIIDSGATHHVTANKSVFSKNHEVRDKVHLPTGAKADISHIGEAFVFEDAVMKNLLLIISLTGLLTLNFSSCSKFISQTT